MKRMIDDKLIKQVDSVIDNNGDLEASKLNRKLYYHPISLYRNAGDHSTDYAFSIIILDNNSAAYTKDTLIAWIKSLYDSVGAGNTIINCSGTYKGLSSVAYWYVQKPSSDYEILFIGFDTSNDYSQSISVNVETFINDASILKDGVNEIYPNV